MKNSSMIKNFTKIYLSRQIELISPYRILKKSSSLKNEPELTAFYYDCVRITLKSDGLR